MVAGLGVTYHAMRYIDELRAAAAKMGADGQRLEAALAPLTSGPGGFGTAHRDLGRRLNDQLVADMEPTASVIAGVDAPCTAIEKASEELKRLQGTVIAEFNAALTRAGGPSVPSWTPPAAPACGGK
jgi:hypothetical protein